MLIIGLILVVLAGIAILVFWIMTLIKQFKGGDTVWGVLTIFFGILAPIWCFMNNQKNLGMKMIIALVVYLIGVAIMIASGAMKATSEMNTIPGFFF